MIYTNLTEYITFVDTKAPILPCFPFISKPKFGDIITTGRHMNYQTFNNLHFTRLPKSIYLYYEYRISLYSDWIKTRAVKLPTLYLLVSLNLFRCLEKPQTIVFNIQNVTRRLLQDEQRLPSKSEKSTVWKTNWSTCTSYWVNNNSIFCEYIVPAAKHVGADLIEVTAPETAEVESGRKSFKGTAKSVRKQHRENSCVVAAGKRLPADSFQQNLPNKPVGR